MCVCVRVWCLCALRLHWITHIRIRENRRITDFIGGLNSPSEKQQKKE